MIPSIIAGTAIDIHEATLAAPFASSTLGVLWKTSGRRQRLCPIDPSQVCHQSIYIELSAVMRLASFDFAEFSLPQIPRTIEHTVIGDGGFPRLFGVEKCDRAKFECIALQARVGLGVHGAKNCLLE
jgi:hypothetical protein